MNGCKWCLQGQCWSHGQEGAGGGMGGQGGVPDMAKVKAIAALLQMTGQGGMMGGGGMGGGGKGAAALIQMMGQGGMMGGGGKGGSKSGKAAKGQGKSQTKSVDGVVIKTLEENLAWKGRLMQAFCSTHKCVCTKESLVYTTTKEQGEGFVCFISSDKFENVYGSEGVCSTKKQAEENAAMVTMQTEFPVHYKVAPQAAKKIGADLSHEHSAKEKAGLSSGGQDPISKLIHSMNVVFGRTLAKGEIVITVQDIGGWAFKATCNINCSDPPRSFEGKQVAGTSKQNRKQAEQSAAQVALEGFQDEIDEAMPVHLAKKEAKAAEQAAKRAEHAAANEAAGEAPPSKKAKILKKK